MKTTVLLSKEEFVEKINQGYNRRMFILSEIKEAIADYAPYEAFALSRLLPKEILNRLLAERNIGTFTDKLLDFHVEMSKGGPLVELENTSIAEKTFLAIRGPELLNRLMNS